MSSACLSTYHCLLMFPFIKISVFIIGDVWEAYKTMAISHYCVCEHTCARARTESKPNQPRPTNHITRLFVMWYGAPFLRVKEGWWEGFSKKECQDARSLMSLTCLLTHRYFTQSSVWQLLYLSVSGSTSLNEVSDRFPQLVGWSVRISTHTRQSTPCPRTFEP